MIGSFENYDVFEVIILPLLLSVCTCMCFSRSV